MRFVKPLLFIGAVMLMVELSFRVYLFGANSLNPWKMDSYNQIHTSGMTQPASDPAVYYELIPNLDTLYKGVRFATNSAGLRDIEYAKQRPDGVFRVAVLGSSWTMGSGVPQEQIWHSVMESSLSAEYAGTDFEFLNFGVDQYGMAEIVATLEQKVAAWQPDLILVAITNYTPTVLWPDPPQQYKSQPRRHPFFNYYTLRVLDLRLGLGLYPDSDERRPSATAEGAILQQMRRAFDRFSAFSAAHDVPVAMVKLAYAQRWATKNAPVRAYDESINGDLVYFGILDRIGDSGYKPAQLRISTWDSHPNPLAHELIAAAILEELQERSFLPAADD